MGGNLIVKPVIANEVKQPRSMLVRDTELKLLRQARDDEIEFK